MLHKFGLGLFCIAASLSASVYSMEPHMLQQGLSLEYELPSNVPQTFINPMFWPVEANCKVFTEDEKNDLLVMGLAKKGKLNDIPVSAGESIRISVVHGQNLKINADSGAKVEITNFGQHLVKVVCSTA